jgi:hypothetical protein
MDFVDWCRDKLGMESTAEVIAMGNRMIQQNIIRSLEKRDRRGIFKVAGDLFYRFSNEVTLSLSLSSLGFSLAPPQTPSALPACMRGSLPSCLVSRRWRHSRAKWRTIHLSRAFPTVSPRPIDWP